MIKPGSQVYLDTMVILESHSGGIWKGLTGVYKLATVEKCVEEIATGNRRTRNRVAVDIPTLRTVAKVETVTFPMIAALDAKLAGRVDLDPGERELLAFILSLDRQAYLICAPDKACIRACDLIGRLDQVVPLEDLANDAGLRYAATDQFTRKWHASFRAKLLMGMS